MHGGDIYRNRAELDFSVNINPLGMPDRVRRALLEAVGECSCYPDIRYEELRQAVSYMTGAPKKSILCGSGASELFLAIVHGLRPEKAVIPVPSFYGYERAAEAVQPRLCFYEMKEEAGFCLDAGILPWLSEDVDMLFLANPNNPVGNRIPSKLLEEILQHCRSRHIQWCWMNALLNLPGIGNSTRIWPEQKNSLM